jgi:NADH dehydrogenase/NADH:ubiquinone oxidoreductase subunit G
MNLTINGRILAASPDESILDVARRNGIAIPTLCHHEGLEPAGGCRLCVVEIRRRGADAVRIAPACLYPIQDGLRVETHTPRILQIRTTLLDLLLARAPEAPRIQELAFEHGIRHTSFVPRRDPDKCVLCGICVRACAALGAHAISTAGRGAEGVVSLPFGGDAADCLGCGACALSCPTAAIDMTDRDGTRRIWGRTFERLRCAACGCPTLTREHAAHLAARTGLPPETFGICDRCRREQTARRIESLLWK